MNFIKCQKCNSKRVLLEVSGPHIKATCANCAEYIQFVKQGEFFYVETYSTFVTAIGYDCKGHLDIRLGDRSYVYVGIDILTFNNFMRSESVGKFYTTNIKSKYSTLKPQILNQFQNTNQMADKIIQLKIDVSKIKKEWLFKGEKGTYCDMTLFYNAEKDEYENNGMIVQQVPKAVYEKNKEEKGPILGNCKEFTKGGGAEAAKKDAENAKMVSNSDDLPDDLPF